MEWYIPITILPGVALLILSTSNFIIALNAEIKELKRDITENLAIIQQKIKQLKRLSYAVTGHYICALLFTFSGLLAAIPAGKIFVISSLVLAILFMSASIVLLIIYALKAVKVRQQHLSVENTSA